MKPTKTTITRSYKINDRLFLEVRQAEGGAIRFYLTKYTKKPDSNRKTEIELEKTEARRVMESLEYEFELLGEAPTP